MKKLLTILIILTAFPIIHAFGAYTVEIDDDTYVSDETYFAPVSTWDEVGAQTINLENGKIIFYAGKGNQSARINAAVMPVNTTDKTITYTSGDTSIASVDESGNVTCAGKAGNTVIDVRCGKAFAKVNVSVVIGVEGVEMSQDTMTLYADKPITAQLSAVIYPENATIRDLEWYSGDESIAYVDKDGLVSPCGVGTTDVYVKTVDGGFTAKCAVTVDIWEERSEEIPVTYTEYDITIDEMVEAQMTASPTIFTNDTFPASSENVEQYVNPENLVTGYEKYQFINLGMSNNIDAKTLDAYLNGKGVLSGQGTTFKAASDEYGISEVYLVIHSCLETGNGTSELATGVEYNGVTVYNMFGIGAVDDSPVESGAEYAYQMGWTDIETAISGGAEWISENYINNPQYSQDTLYKMRWNPESPATHQYATDIEWASKQAEDMSSMFEAFPTAEYCFDVPVYIGQDRLEIE
ncbi:MAG: Ig-like domain-containing protein [Oscillospiraceae bacterium]|nr:Ig-like domain-containing protein [Oscillospiraceae bacterium]